MIQEEDPRYTKIRRLISRGKFQEAVDKYYESLGNEPFDDLNEELLYLKRLGGIPLKGRDVLACRPNSTWSDFIKEHVWEYCACMEKVMEELAVKGQPTSTEILSRRMPTIEQMINLFQKKENCRVSWEDGNLKKKKGEKITIEYLGHITFPYGKLFDRYPNMGIWLSMKEEGKDVVQYPLLWVTLDSTRYEKEIVKKGLCLDSIQTYKHAKWKIGTKRRMPDFISLQSLKEVRVWSFSPSGLKYTGRTHQIDGQQFYEVDLLTKAPLQGEKVPPFVNYFSKVLREGENELRQNHGLPKIGEGWVSELQLYNLVKEIFPDAQHHARPDWLKPQELDIYMPSKNLAIEFQGLQHLEPVSFFGGEEGLLERQKLDQRKRKKCKSKAVRLIEWRYDEPIDRANLLNKLKELSLPSP